MATGLACEGAGVCVYVEFVTECACVLVQFVMEWTGSGAKGRLGNLKVPHVLIGSPACLCLDPLYTAGLQRQLGHRKMSRQSMQRCGLETTFLVVALEF